MTCTTIDRHCGSVDECQSDAGETCKNGREGLVGRMLSRLGEGLFHYRYLRAGMIERALERQDDGRGTGQ